MSGRSGKSSDSSSSLSFDELRALFESNSCQDPGFREEVTFLFGQITPEILKTVGLLNEKIQLEEPERVVDELRAFNGKVRAMHNSGYVADAEQEPVELNIDNLTPNQLMTLNEDILKMVQKNSNGRKKDRKPGSEDNWKVGCEKMLTDLRDTGFIIYDDGEAASLANYCEKMDRLEELTQLVSSTSFIPVADRALFQPTGEVKKGEGLANAFQIDPAFLMALFMAENGLSPGDNWANMVVLSRILKERPLTKTLVTALTKNKEGPYIFLSKITEEELSIFSSPFLMSKSRFTYCLSVAFVVPSRLGLTASKGVPFFLGEIIDLRLKKSLIISSDKDTTTWYEHAVHRVLTTPNPDDVWKNRTSVKRNGLMSVVIKMGKEDDMFASPTARPRTSPTSASGGAPKVGADTSTRRKDPSSKMPEKQSWSITPRDFVPDWVKVEKVLRPKETQSSQGFMVLDIEGTAAKPVEICALYFDPDPTRGKGGVRDLFFCHIPENMTKETWTHGLDGTSKKYTVNPNWVTDFKAFWERHDATSYCLGATDIKDFLIHCDCSGRLMDLMPLGETWEQRKKMHGFEFLNLATGHKCSRSKIHMKPKNFDKSRCHPHCAETDCFFMICMAMGCVPTELTAST